MQGNVVAATFNNKAECLSLVADAAAARLIGRRREQQQPWMASRVLSESMRMRWYLQRVMLDDDAQGNAAGLIGR